MLRRGWGGLPRGEGIWANFAMWMGCSPKVTGSPLAHTSPQPREDVFIMDRIGGREVSWGIWQISPSPTTRTSAVISLTAKMSLRLRGTQKHHFYDLEVGSVLLILESRRGSSPTQINQVVSHSNQPLIIIAMTTETSASWTTRRESLWHFVVARLDMVTSHGPSWHIPDAGKPRLFAVEPGQQNVRAGDQGLSQEARGDYPVCHLPP